MSVTVEVQKKLNKKLTKTLKSKWIKALESGRYKQVTGELQSIDGRNCCLGVLCRVMNIKHDQFNQHGSVSGTGLDKVLDEKTEQKLIDMNDSDRKSFKEIAAFLRKSKKV